MPTVSEFLENNQSGVPPALQSIIDKVTGYANKSIGGAMGQTKAQGDALGDVMKTIGGLEQQRMKDTSETARLGITQAGENMRQDKSIATGFKALGIEEAGKDRRAPLTLMDDPRESQKGIGATSTSDSWFKNPDNLGYWNGLTRK